MDKRPIAIPRQAGLYVRQAREEQGLTRDQLAERSAVSKRTLASLELGDSKGVQLDKLLSVLGALGLGLYVGEVPEGSASTPRQKRGGASAGADSLNQSYNDLLRSMLSTDGIGDDVELFIAGGERSMNGRD